ncbi:hypothetical protein FCI58_29030 [Enterobacter hormaechei]|uniref:hypothetical protein n=1 Tax=Enterobacter asburiae TaxID=61645 RepID=UPI0015760FDA|nr:hypothetical protein [Enterobacter asburiae]NQF23034.1 hypothetical protein [Enterobacter hormaechei]NQF31014.1 hypothetical protein [Enterobacter asburiae]
MKTINIEVPEKGFVVFDCERNVLVDGLILNEDQRVLLEKQGDSTMHRYLHPTEKIFDHETLKRMVKEITRVDSSCPDWDNTTAA